MQNNSTPFRIETDHFNVDTRDADALIAWNREACRAMLAQPGTQAILRSVQSADDMPVITQTVTRFREHCTHLIVAGAGGSGLSGRALAMLKTGMHACANSHTLHVLDNLDAHALPNLLASLPLAQTALLIVSKSGSTVETYAQAHLLLAAFSAADRNTLSKRACVITVPGENPLRQLAEKHDIPIIDHDPALGGRFSIFSAVGMIPAGFAGLDLVTLRRGAAEKFAAEMHDGSAAMRGAAQMVSHMRAGKNIAVVMPYCERLYGVALWWRQSWAESLGKNGMGSTPVANIGTADQHSQLQLYLDGPADKCFTLLLTERGGKGPVLPAIEGPLGYLSGHPLGDLIAAQQEGTLRTLTGAGKPVRVLRIPEANEETVGALIAHFTLEIVFAGAILGINPFDQPAVEESKRLSHAYFTGQP